MSETLRLDEINGALINNAALKAAVTGVIPEPSVTQEFPYILLGELVENSGGRTSANLSECLYTLHIWSRAYGRDEVVRIRKLILAALPDRVIYDGFELLRDYTDNVKSWHGILTLKYYDWR